MRKFYLSLAALGVLLLGLVVVFLFRKFSDGVWNIWCVAVAGIAGGYLVSNVISKKIDVPRGKKK